MKFKNFVLLKMKNDESWKKGNGKLSELVWRRKNRKKLVQKFLKRFKHWPPSRSLNPTCHKRTNHLCLNKRKSTARMGCEIVRALGVWNANLQKMRSITHLIELLAHIGDTVVSALPVVNDETATGRVDGAKVENEDVARAGSGGVARAENGGAAAEVANEAVENVAGVEMAVDARGVAAVVGVGSVKVEVAVTPIKLLAKTGINSRLINRG